MEEKIQIEGHVENINGAPEAFISSLENATGISLGWSWGENGAIDFSGDDLAEADCVNTIRPVCSRFASRYAIAVEVGDHVTLVCKGKKMKTTECWLTASASRMKILPLCWNSRSIGQQNSNEKK